MATDAKTALYFTPDLASSKDEIIVTDASHCSLLSLNRPKALNSLTLNMIEKIYEQLTLNEGPAKKYTTIVRSEGNAFCAGGDVKALYLKKKENPDAVNTYGKQFFRKEYTMNHFIANMKTNYVAIMDGITMGGGVGISLPGRFRIATERTQWAMPETAIGLFPDVGASYFLPRLRGQLGMYLALTGSTLKGADALHAGVATHFVPSHLLNRVLERLQEVEYDPESVDNAIKERAIHPPPSDGFAQSLPIIEECFAKDSIEAIIDSLNASKTEFGQATVDRLQKMSPLSLKITFKEMRAGRFLSMEQCFQMEYRLASHCLEGEDFYEGVRAALVDKDRHPKWKYTTLAEVPSSVVDSYFRPVEDEFHLNPPAVSRL